MNILLILIILSVFGYLINEKNRIESIKLTITILISFCAGIAFNYWIQYGLKMESFFWTVISPLATIVMVVFIGFQAFATKELADKTRMPNVNIGLKSRGKNETKICIHNLSNFTVWIWLNIEFFNNEKDRECRKNAIMHRLSYEGRLISPNQACEFPVENIRPHIQALKDDNVIYALIEYRCAVDSNRPGSDIKSTNLYYGYGPEKVWWITGLGIEFVPIYDYMAGKKT